MPSGFVRAKGFQGSALYLQENGGPHDDAQLEPRGEVGWEEDNEENNEPAAMAQPRINGRGRRT